MLSTTCTRRHTSALTAADIPAATALNGTCALDTTQYHKRRAAVELPLSGASQPAQCTTIATRRSMRMTSKCAVNSVMHATAYCWCTGLNSSIQPLPASDRMAVSTQPDCSYNAELHLHVCACTIHCDVYSSAASSSAASLAKLKYLR